MKWMESITPLGENPEIVQLSAVRSRAADEAGAAIARQLNGPLTALLLYMNEIKQHSHQFSHAPGGLPTTRFCEAQEIPASACLISV